MNSPCAKSLPSAKCLYAPLAAMCPPCHDLRYTKNYSAKKPPGISCSRRFLFSFPPFPAYAGKKGGFGVSCRNFNHSQAQGADLVAVAAALSVYIGQGKTADELAVLASLFDLMRSNLALMALNTVGDDVQSGQRRTPAQAEARADFYDALIGPGSSPGPDV